MPRRRDARRQRLGELDQRDVGGGEMGEEALQVELRVTGDARMSFSAGTSPGTARRRAYSRRPAPRNARR